MALNLRGTKLVYASAMSKLDLAGISVLPLRFKFSTYTKGPFVVPRHPSSIHFLQQINPLLPYCQNSPLPLGSSKPLLRGRSGSTAERPQSDSGHYRAEGLHSMVDASRRRTAARGPVMSIRCGRYESVEGEPASR
jgi:hypothetical protein